MIGDQPSATMLFTVSNSFHGEVQNESAYTESASRTPLLAVYAHSIISWSSLLAAIDTSFR